MFICRHCNGNFYLWFTDEQGKRKRISTRTKKKTEAMRFLQTFKREEYERTQMAKKKILSDVIHDYLQYAVSNFAYRTVVGCRIAFRNFLAINGDHPLIYYTPQHFDLYKSERLKTVKPATVNIELRILRAFFNTAKRWKLIIDSPFQVKLVKVPQYRPTFFTKEEFQKLLSVIEENWLKEIVIVAVSTGLRRGEIVNLRWESVDFGRKLLYVENNPTFRTKSGKMRILPLNDAALRILQMRQQNNSSEYVFNLNGKQVFPSWISHLFKRYVRLANISNPKINFHSLRHTFASWLAQDGVSIYVIKDFLGHSDLKTTEIYSHLQPQNLHSEVNRIVISMN